LFSWGGLLNDDVLLSDAFKVPSLKTGQLVPLIGSLTAEEEQMFVNMMHRLRTVFEVS
jgi:proline dehydrogenase